jgi:Fic family protein
MVPEEVEHLCDYVNDNWSQRSALHLAAYVLWRINWIHPFADGNGRTARTVSYVLLSTRIDSLLPGAPTIPDQIAQDKTPYYEALESADAAWKESPGNAVAALEKMLGDMLAKQLVAAAEEASRDAPSATAGS